MGNVSKIYIEVAVDGKGGIKVLRQIGTESEKTGKKGQKSFRRMDKSVGSFNKHINITRGLVAKFGVAFGAWRIYEMSKGFHEVAVEAERTKAMLEGLYGSAEKGAAAFGWIMDLDVPFGLGAIQDSFVKLRSVGIDPTTGSLEALLAGVAAFGGTDEVLKRASIAIQQMAGKGVISMEELRQQLGEAIPTAIPVMAQQLGMTVREMVDIISKGQLDASTGLDAFFTGMAAKYGSATARMMGTWGGMTRKMAKEWTAFRIQVMESGPFQVMKERLGDLLTEIDRLKKEGQLDLWAADMADGVLAAIDLMMLGFQGLSKALYGFRAVFGVMAERYYKNRINSINLAIQGLENLIESNVSVELNQRQINDLKALRAEMLLNKTASAGMADTNIQKMDQYSQKIQEARNKLAQLRADMEARRGERPETTADLSVAKKTTGIGGDQTKKDVTKLSNLERDLAAAQEEYERAMILGGGTGEIMAQQLRRGVGDNLKIMVQEVEEQFTILDNLSQRTAEAMEQNFSDFYFDVMRGEFDDLGDYADAMLMSIQRATADVMGQMTKEALFGGGSSGSSGLVQGIGKWIATSLFHGGGEVGRTPAPSRAVPAPLFYNAPRLHRGLAGDEFPAILQKGETVYAKGSGPSIQVNVINESGEPLTAEQGDVRFDGQKYIADVHIDKMINSRSYRQANRQALR